VTIVADVNVEGAKQVAAHINGNGGQALAEALDVSDAAAVKSLIHRVTTEHQQLDYMFNNAGITVGTNHPQRDLQKQDRYRISLCCPNFLVALPAAPGFAGPDPSQNDSRFSPVADSF
jgi:NAD(P)-dependent dehydrogenase (short-subunit alcohol dehydrogenase family)